MAIAQDANPVTLLFANGQDTISGPLTDFRDDRFFIESSVGLVAIPSAGVLCVGAACPEETRVNAADTGVTLTSLDGLIRMVGDLVEVDDNEYVLDTALGVQRISADLVTCEGEGCISASEGSTIDDTVLLTNGGITLRGRLIGMEDGVFILNDDVMGEIRVNSSEFDCSGPGCPPL